MTGIIQFMDQITHKEQEKEDVAIEQTLGRIKRILLVLSGKGGVGKSTVAANLAVALAREGNEVGLLDVDIHGPSVPRLLGLAGSAVLSGDGGMIPVEFTPNLKVMSIGFLIRGSSDPVIWRGPMKYGVIKQFLSNVGWGTLDFLVVDSPPGTGDEPLSVAQMIGSRGEAVIVTTPQQVAVDDVRRSITFCRTVGVPVAGVIENMSGFVCPSCGARHDLFSSDGGKRLAVEMGVPYLGSVPIDSAITRSGDDGKPFVLGEASPAAEAFSGIVSKLTGT